MEKQNLIAETKKTLELIQKQFEAFTWNGNIPNQAEVQMLKQKTMLLYDRLNQLEFAEKTIPVVEEHIEVKQEIIPIAEIPIPQETVQEIKQVEEKIIPVGKQETPVENAESQPSPLRGELERGLPHTEVAEIRREVYSESILPLHPKAEEPDRGLATTSIASSYNGVTSLHDKISSSKNEVAVADKLKLTPITDLSKAIGLNEKFLFIRELFGNNADAFAKAVNEINSCPDFTLASVHTENETKKFGADVKSETYSQFLELVQRRFL